MERGDLIEIKWLDIAEDPVGNPDRAKLPRRSSYALFWEERLDGDIPVLVTTNTLDSDTPDQQGYCIYPRSVVVGIEVIRRKGKRKRKGDLAN